MKSGSETLLKIMHVLAWVVFIGLMIKAGAVVFSYIVSITNLLASKNLYKGLDLSAYREHSFTQYTIMVVYTTTLYCMQAYIAFLMTKLLSTINISRPFNITVVTLMHRISYTIVGIWLLAMVHNIHTSILEKNYGIEANPISGEALFLAGIVYILAQMFKRGLEIQSENELTI